MSLNYKTPPKPGTWVVWDPYVAARYVSIVARNFKSKEAAQKWLDKHQAANDDGYAGCFVLAAEDVEYQA